MMNILPGTVIEINDIAPGFDYIKPSITATMGLTLAQVKAMTGLEQSTIQNWIKRGWVAHPENKRYGEYQLARIFIINALRTSMQLDMIASLLRYLNGDAECREDDIIPDSTLYTHLCSVIKRCKTAGITTADDTRRAVDDCLRDYEEPYDGAKTKLSEALTIMALAFIASEIKKESDRLFAELSL